jgi:hypothetical protein
MALRNTFAYKVADSNILTYKPEEVFLPATKTDTVIHFPKKQNEEILRPKRVLVCAPSNAAVDEIVLQILSEGLIDSEGNKVFPSIVRIGQNYSPLVSKVALDTLVDKYIASGLSTDTNYDSIRQNIIKNATVVCSTLSMTGSSLFTNFHEVGLQDFRHCDHRRGHSNHRSLIIDPTEVQLQTTHPYRRPSTAACSLLLEDVRKTRVLSEYVCPLPDEQISSSLTQGAIPDASTDIILHLDHFLRWQSDRLRNSSKTRTAREGLRLLEALLSDCLYSHRGWLTRDSKRRSTAHSPTRPR